MADLIAALEQRYLDDPRAWAGGNFLLYFEKGNPRAPVSPDVVLVRGVEKWDRPLYKLWGGGTLSGSGRTAELRPQAF
jgi:hypothetical protein